MKSFSFILLLLLLLLPNSYGQQEEFWKNIYQYADAYKEGRFTESRDILLYLINTPDLTPEHYLPYLYNSTGSAYRNLGNLDSATYFYRKSESQMRKAENTDYNLLYSVYNNLALIYEQKFQFKQALIYYAKSESVLNNFPARDTNYYQKLSVLSLNRGIVNFELSEYAKALSDLKKAKQIKSDYGFPFLGNVYFNLAKVYEKLSDYKLSREYYNKSISQYIRDHDSSYYQLGITYLYYGRFEIEHGYKDKGLSLYKKAISNTILNYGNNTPNTIVCYEKIATSYLEDMQYNSALSYAQKALISSCPGFTDTTVFSNPTGHESLHDILLIDAYQIKTKALIGLVKTNNQVQIQDKLYSNQKILEFALEIVRNEIELIRKVHINYFIQENRLALNESFKNVFTDGLEISSMLYTITNDPQYLDRAFNFASLGKSIEFQYEFIRKQKIFDDSAGSELSDFKIKASAYTNLINLEQKKSSPDSSLIAAWKDSLFTIFSKQEKIILEMLERRDLADLFRIELNELNIRDIQKKLKRNQTLVDYTVSGRSTTDKSLFVFIVSRSSVDLVNINMDQTAVSAINSVQEQLNSFRLSQFTDSDRDSLYHDLNTLYTKFFLPFEAHIEGQEIIIIPDEELHYIPFDALVRNHKQQLLNPEFLIQEYGFSYLINTKYLNQNIPNLLHIPRVIAYTEKTDISLDESNQLEGATKEVENILKMFKGKIFHNLENKEVMEKSFNDNKIMHFAMHSYAQDSTFENAYILLDNNKDSVLSNKLFDYEISQVKTSSPMVVLSSCESGLGQHYSGEGILSLSRSFLISGAESVVNTYWPINDRSSSIIMTDYYSGLKRGWSKSRSLQTAKINYLENASPTLQHPYYWAGYRIFGNAQRLALVSKKTVLLFGILFLMLVTSIIYFKRNA